MRRIAEVTWYGKRTGIIPQAIRNNGNHTADMTQLWRTRCQTLEEQLEDTPAALGAPEALRLELSADYKHALGQLWKANAGIQRRGRQHRPCAACANSIRYPIGPPWYIPEEFPCQ